METNRNTLQKPPQQTPFMPSHQKKKKKEIKGKPPSYLLPLTSNNTAGLQQVGFVTPSPEYGSSPVYVLTVTGGSSQASANAPDREGRLHQDDSSLHEKGE